MDYFDNLLYLSNYIRFNDRLHAVMLRTIDRAEEDRLTPEAKALNDIEIRAASGNRHQPLGSRRYHHDHRPDLYLYECCESG